MPKVANQDKDLQAAHEIGRIYNSLLDKKTLCEFFLESVLIFVKECDGFLFLAGNNDQLWLESKTTHAEPPASLKREADSVFQNGQPVYKEDSLYLPLIVRNTAIGLACFLRKSGAPPFTQLDFTLVSDLSFQLAGALKNLLLFEQNFKMERLAAVGQTVGAVLHEIKNIIQLASFSDECLRMGLREHKEKYITQGTEGIGKALRELDGFTYEMLSLTKDYKIKPQKIKIQSLLGELKRDFQRQAEEFGVELDFQAEESFPEVDGEYKSLYRALINLVKNSFEARGEKKPYIRIRVRSKDKDFYEIVVEDNGKGMTEEVRAKVFQAFYTTKGEQGTGLGLMIIDRTIKAHQGKIELESQSGAGTKFILTLLKKLST